MLPAALCERLEEELGPPDAIDSVVEHPSGALAPLPVWHANARREARRLTVNQALQLRERGVLDQWPPELHAYVTAEQATPPVDEAEPMGYDEAERLGRPLVVDVRKRDGIMRAPMNPARAEAIRRREERETLRANEEEAQRTRARARAAKRARSANSTAKEARRAAARNVQ